MGETTGIAWTDATWNPWRGCRKVSAGCAHCYMYRDQARYGRDPKVVTRSRTTFADPTREAARAARNDRRWSAFDHTRDDAPPGRAREVTS